MELALQQRLALSVVVVIATVAVAFPATLAFGDEAPPYPTTSREYFIKGLEDYPDYTFVIVHSPRRGNLESQVLSNNDQVTLTSYRFGTTTHLYAIKGNVPRELTRAWLNRADALSVECTSSFARVVRSANDDRSLRLERVTFKVRMDVEDQQREENGDDDDDDPKNEAEAPRPAQLPSDLQVVGQLEGPLRLVPARLVRLNRDNEVVLDRDLLADAGNNDDDDDAKSGISSRAATNSGMLIFASGMGVLMLLGLVALRRMRD